MVNSATQITATSPMGRFSDRQRHHTANGTGTSAGTFTFLAPPMISGLAPTSGPETGGTAVVITGTGFTQRNRRSIRRSCRVELHGRLGHPNHHATSPARTGSVTVTVTTPNGTGTSAGTFAFLPAPTVSGLAPTSGPEVGGTTVVITGTGFTRRNRSEVRQH